MTARAILKLRAERRRLERRLFGAKRAARLERLRKLLREFGL